MRRVLYIIIFAILSFFVFSCDLKIKTWEDEEQSTPGAETPISPTSISNDAFFTKSNNIITFLLSSSVSLVNGTFVKRVEDIENLKDFSIKTKVVSGNNFYYGISLLNDNASDFKAVFISCEGEIRIGSINKGAWSDKIKIAESINVNKGFGKENEIRLLFDEQTGNFSLFINSVHECDFYLDGIRTADDLSYYLSVSTNSSSSVVEFHLEEEA